VTPTWHSPDEPAIPPVTGTGAWLRVVLRGGVLGAVTFGGLALLLFLRLVERPLFGMQRPVTPGITRAVCMAAFVILGIGFRQRGTPMWDAGAVVANHASWLDIFALNACQRVYFVAKDDVAGWPGIGWLARATGTLFIARKGTEARAQADQFTARLAAGQRLLFFPEGTSTDGQRVLPFRSTLFAAFLAPGLRETLRIQPVTVVWRGPPGADPRFYGWWGSMGFGPHLLAVLAAPRQGSVEVTYHPPLRVADFADRKALAAACEAAVRGALPSAPPK
jgi:1-acyl-sn-glycerol-3-phosphate acyltransferase